ncbi:MAG: FMN-binding negative transcriptional regulator [Thiotrichales bacterium]|nr:FMN-binding negative transcriptional regulator [Thiotrichales bacterium]
MHPNRIFRRASRESALEFARERGFGTLTVAGPEGVLAAHVPFVLDEERVLAHLVRVNPLARHLGGGPASALLIVSGPDGYVSPDWYGEPQLVPTWNYVAVHLRGELRLLDDTALRPILDRLSAEFETRLAPKPPWKTDKVDDGLLRRMMRQIIPIELSLESVESTFKLNQNRSDTAGSGAAAALAAGGTPGTETRALAALMQEASRETAAD